MKNNIYELKRIKEFCKLSGVYFRRLQRGICANNLANQLDSEVFIYEYYRDIGELDKMEYNGFINKDEDIDENWYALTKAVYDIISEMKSYPEEFENMHEESPEAYEKLKKLVNNFTQNQTTGIKDIDKYLLKMSNR